MRVARLPWIQTKYDHPIFAPSFLAFWLGSSISVLGDQFVLVALPWLVLELTGSKLALGTVLMTAAIPNAAFALIGGAMADRLPARRILVTTGVLRALILTCVVVLLWQNSMRMWHLYVLALAFGAADAISAPVSGALIPAIVRQQHLKLANSLMQTAVAMMQIVGPATGGLIIRANGLTWLLLFAGITFVGNSIALLKLPKTYGQFHVPCAETRKPNTIESIGQGLREILCNPTLTSLAIVSSAVNFCMSGPIAVGLASLGKYRYDSAALFGTLLSFFGGGALAGSLLAGIETGTSHHRSDPDESRSRISLKSVCTTGMQFVLFAFFSGLGMIAIGVVSKFAYVAVIVVAIGAGSGYTNILLTTWVQRYVEKAILGRVMGMFMFASLVLVSLSYVVAGALASWSLTASFVLPGVALLFISIVGIRTRMVRDIE